MALAPCPSGIHSFALVPNNYTLSSAILNDDELSLMARVSSQVPEVTALSPRGCSIRGV